MSEPIQIALIGLGGAIVGALLVAILQPLWAAMLAPKSRLAVSITQQPYLVSSFLAKAVEEYAALRWSSQTKIRPKEDIIEKLRWLASRGLTVIVDIENRSNKIIENISIHLKDSSDFLADYLIDGSVECYFFGKNLEIGDLKPDSRCRIVIWHKYGIISDYGGPDEDLIKITARQYDEIYKIFPIPPYISFKYILFKRSIIQNISPFAAIALGAISLAITVMLVLSIPS